MRQKSRTLLLEALRKPIQMDKDISSIVATALGY